MKKLLLICLSLLSLNVYANGCGGEFQAATGTCRIIGPDGRQILYNSAPPQSASPPAKIIKYVDVHVPDKYGALASDKNTGNIGDAANANSLAEAKKLALKACAEGGKNKNCKVRSWVKNGCIAAVAGGKRGSESILFPAADVPGKTEYIAMNSCHKAKLPSCKIIVSETCSVPEGMYK